MELFSTINRKHSETNSQKGLFRLENTRQISPLAKTLSDEPVIYEIIGNVVTASITQRYYSIQEPELTDNEQNIFEQLIRGLYEVMNMGPSDNPEAYLEKCTHVILAELNISISEDELQKILYYIYRNIVGFEKIEALLRDQMVAEIRYAGKSEPVEIVHRKYGKLHTDILLKPEEISTIIRKLLLGCDKELSTTKSTVECQFNDYFLMTSYVQENPSHSQFWIKKKIFPYLSLAEVIKQKKVPAEVLAFLWLLLENKTNIFICKDRTLLNLMSYFIPAQAKVFTNIPFHYPNPLTITYVGETSAQEDYALIDNYMNQPINGTLIASVETINETNKVVCYMEEGTFKKVVENGKEIFGVTQKLGTHLNESMFLRSKGATVVEELRARTRLIMAVAKSNINEDDRKKIFAMYYNNPEAVLKRAGMA